MQRSGDVQINHRVLSPLAPFSPNGSKWHQSRWSASLQNQIQTSSVGISEVSHYYAIKLSKNKNTQQREKDNKNTKDFIRDLSTIIRWDRVKCFASFVGSNQTTFVILWTIHASIWQKLSITRYNFICWFPCLLLCETFHRLFFSFMFVCVTVRWYDVSYNFVATFGETECPSAVYLLHVCLCDGQSPPFHRCRQ